MEKALRNYACMTVGDDITIEFNKKEYILEVAECKPGNRAVSIIETDVTVDFDGNDLPENQTTGNVKHRDINGETTDSSESEDELVFGDGKKKMEEEESSTEEDDDSFKPFTGSCHSLRSSAQLNQEKWKDEDW